MAWPKLVAPGAYLHLDGHPRDGGSVCMPVQPVEGGEYVLLTAAHVAGALHPGWEPDSRVFTNQVVGSASGSERIGVGAQCHPPEPWPLCVVDAAIVNPLKYVTLTRNIPDHGRAPSNYLDPYDPDLLGMRVHKVGAKTGATTGEIWEIGVSFAVDAPIGRIKYLHGYFILNEENDTPFSLPGDSGALVFTDDGGAAIGMVVAMDDPSQSKYPRTFCIPMAFIVETLHLRLPGQTSFL